MSFRKTDRMPEGVVMPDDIVDSCTEKAIDHVDALVRSNQRGRDRHGLTE